MTRIFSLTGIGICQKDNVRLIPIKNNIQILLTIKKDFIKISPYTYIIHVKYVVNQAIKIKKIIYKLNVLLIVNCFSVFIL